MRLAVCGFAALLLLAMPAEAEMSGGKIKIGVLTDLSGPYEQNSGVGSVEAAKMAAEEFGNTINGVPLEIDSADHQNKPDIGAAIARRWFDLDGVDAVTDLVNSAWLCGLGNCQDKQQGSSADQRRLGGLHRQGLRPRYVGPLGL